MSGTEALTVVMQVSNLNNVKSYSNKIDKNVHKCLFNNFRDFNKPLTPSHI